eukprot:1390426-Pleurochrysis_carterae.AAC.1
MRGCDCVAPPAALPVSRMRVRAKGGYLPEQSELARWEIEVHRSFKHANLMPLIDSCVVPAPNGAEEFRLLMPLYPDGTLLDAALRHMEQRTRIPEKQALKATRARAHTHARTRTRTRSRTRARSHAHAYGRAHAHAHARAHVLGCVLSHPRSLACARTQVRAHCSACQGTRACAHAVGRQRKE